MITHMNIRCDKRLGTKFYDDRNKLRVKLERGKNSKKLIKIPPCQSC